MSFQAKIKLGNLKKGPLTHTGFKGRVVKKGETFTTISSEEATYYRSQPGFSVAVTKGKLATPGAKQALDENEIDDEITDAELDEADDEQHDDEAHDDEPDEDEAIAASSASYKRSDLKKLTRIELRKLIKTDEAIPLSLKDVPKTSSKKEIIGMILDAQRDARRERTNPKS